MKIESDPFTIQMGCSNSGNNAPLVGGINEEALPQEPPTVWNTKSPVKYLEIKSNNII